MCSGFFRMDPPKTPKPQNPDHMKYYKNLFKLDQVNFIHSFELVISMVLLILYHLWFTLQLLSSHIQFGIQMHARPHRARDIAFKRSQGLISWRLLVQVNEWVVPRVH